MGDRIYRAHHCDQAGECLAIKPQHPLASPEFVSDLSREVGVTLSYLQPTSEGGQVFLVSGLFEGFPLSDILQRLQRRADVISVTEEIAGGDSALALIVVKLSASVADPSHPASRGTESPTAETGFRSGRRHGGVGRPPSSVSRHELSIRGARS